MELTKSAAKELVIEAEIRKLTEVWKECKFELLKYTKARIQLVPPAYPVKSGLRSLAGCLDTTLDT